MLAPVKVEFGNNGSSGAASVEPGISGRVVLCPVPDQEPLFDLGGLRSWSLMVGLKLQVEGERKKVSLKAVVDMAVVFLRSLLVESVSV